MTAEGTVSVPFDLDAHRLACLEAAERETDEHKAFHLRSAMPIPSSLCVQCGTR